jgi:hypothetical protein
VAGGNDVGPVREEAASKKTESGNQKRNQAKEMREIDTLFQPDYTSVCSVPLQLICSGGSSTNSSGSPGR